MTEFILTTIAGFAIGYFIIAPAMEHIREYLKR